MDKLDQILFISYESSNDLLVKCISILRNKDNTEMMIRAKWWKFPLQDLIKTA